MSNISCFWWSLNSPTCWGFRLPHAPTGGVLIVAQMEGNAHWDNILRGSAKPPTSMGESHCIRDRERVTINTWRRITQLPAHTLCCIWQQSCCPWQQLLFLSSSLLFTFSHTLCTLSSLLSNIASFIGISWSTWRGQ